MTFILGMLIHINPRYYRKYGKRRSIYNYQLGKLKGHDKLWP